MSWYDTYRCTGNPAPGLGDVIEPQACAAPLVAGCQYTVAEIDARTGNIRVECTPGWFAPWRFRLVRRPQ